MKLSVIIPTKNEEQNLPELLNSIKKQTFKPFEIIVADADSDDDTARIAMENGAKVVKGGMPGVGRNNGAAIATGDLFLFLDADVELRDAKTLENATKEIKSRSLDVATGNVVPLSANAWDIFSHDFYNRYARFWGSVRPHAPGFFIFAKKSLHDKIQGFRSEVTFAEDHDYVSRAAKHGKFGILNTASVYVSIRRMKRDGRLNVAVKYILAELHLIFLGPIKHDRFNYTFGYKKYGGKE
ncbi:glycosyltransferase [Patescibacteria group bacterium]|nr:glycosyltransferase [Patescibacteria group bacterium]